jgi:hypothetical protein
MGLLMSDTMLIDPTLDETMRLLDSRSELAYANDAARESYEDDGTDVPAWHRTHDLVRRSGAARSPRRPAMRWLAPPRPAAAP